MQETWPDIIVVFSYESKLTGAVTDIQSTLLTQQTCLLNFFVTLRAPMGIKLVVAVLPSRDDGPTLKSKTPREQLNIDPMKGLKAKAVGLDKERRTARWISAG